MLPHACVTFPANTLIFGRYANLDSKIAPVNGYPGDKDEATEAHILVRRGDDYEGNKAIWMKVN